MVPPEYSETIYNKEQVQKYAQDIAEIYNLEKEKRKKLEAANLQLREYAGALNQTICQLKEANAELNEAYLDTIRRLVMVAEFKDEDTGYHITRISRYCALIAEKIGLPAAEVKNILSASPMHDVGKISIPESILMKPGKLTAREFEIVKSHTTTGARILSDSKARVIQVAQQIALSHHEKWNGKGYPYGLAGEEIPLTGRIVGIVDVFDALITKRPYKDPYPLEIALDIIIKERGVHFDPEVTDVFLDHVDAIMRIKEEVESLDLSEAEFRWSERDEATPE